MTKETLATFGLFEESPMLYPNRYWCNVTQSNIIIHKNDTPETIMDKIFQEGIDQGTKIGMEKRSDQIMSLLKNKDL